MFKKPITMFATAAVAASLVSAGCATTSGDAQNQAAGALLGAALGCGIGALITQDARGCAIGAAIGGMAGWGVVKVRQGQVKQVSSAQDSARLFGLTKPVASPLVKIKSGTSSPQTLRPGQTVTITTDYALLLPPSASVASVDESWTLKKDGKVLHSFPGEASKRAAGGYARDWEMDLPANSAPGTYVVEHKVRAGSSYDTQQSSFVVKS